MSREQLKRLTIGLGILVLIWAGLSFARRWGGDRVDGFEPARFDRSSVTEVVIERPGDTLTLARSGAGWKVNGLPAAEDPIDQLLADLADSSGSGEVVAESPSSHARLGIDSAGAKRVTVRGGDRTLLSYVVGNRGSGYGSVYLRLENEDRVYQVRSRLADAVERRLDEWRDKRILDLPGDSIGGVDVGRGRTRFSIERADTGWTVGGAPADSVDVARWLRQLARLSATGFPTPAQADSADFGKPDRSLRIRGKTGEVLAALAFDSTGGGFLVRREGNPTIFRIENWTADQVTPADSSLRAKRS